MAKWIVLGIFLLIGFLLWSKITVLIYYDDNGGKIKLRYLLYRRTLVPAPGKMPKKKAKPKRKAKSAKKQPQAEDEKKSLLTTIDSVLDFIKPLPDSVKHLIKKMSVVKLDIYLKVAGDDAADTAISYGRTCAIVHGVLAALRNIFNIRVKAIKIQPDFYEYKSETKVSCRITIRLYAAIACVIKYFRAYLKNMSEYSSKDSYKKIKGGAKNESTSN